MSEPGAPGAEEPDAPGTEEEPIPPGMEEPEETDGAATTVAAAAAPQQAAPDGATVAASAEAPVDGAAAYPYYGQTQTAAAYPGYGEQYTGYDQYYGYWPGYGDTTGYDPYAGYYNADGTPYTYDPNAYAAHDASAATAEAPSAAAENAEATAAADPSATAVTPTPAPSAPADALTSAPSVDAPASAEQAADTTGLSGEHAANLLSVDEKANLEQQQVAAEVAQKEAEERFLKAEEQRRNAKVKADEQAAVAAAAHAQAQAEAQAELHRQLQQRLADAQAASLAQEAEKEKRRAQPVTLKGARLAFTAPKVFGKPAAALTDDQPAGSLPGQRKPDMTIKLEPKPQPPPPAAAAPSAAGRPGPKAEPAVTAPAKKPGQLFLPQPSTVKNAYLLMAQNKKAADKSAPAKQASPPRAVSPRRRPNPPRSPPRQPPSADSDDERNRQRSLQEAARKVKGRGNRRYRPEDGGPAEAPPGSAPLDGMDRRQHEEHRSKHKHHRHHRHRPRDRDGNVIEPGAPSNLSPDRFARPADRAPPSRYVPPPYDQSVDPQATNGRPGQALFPGAFSSYNPPTQAGGHPNHTQSQRQPPMQQSQGYDRYVAPQQHSDLHGAFPSQPRQAPDQGIPRHPSAPQQTSGLPMLSDSSEDEDELPLPGSTSTRAMSVLQKYLSGSGGAATEAPVAAAAPPRPAAPAPAAAPMLAPRSTPSVQTASYIPTEPLSAQTQVKARPAQGRAAAQQAPAAALAASGYSSDSEHSQLNGNLGDGVGRRPGANGVAAAAGASDDMDMSPILDKGDALDAKALAKLPAQLREAAAAAMARHKAELPTQPMERSIDTPGEPAGRPAQHAKRAQRQYRQRGGEEEPEAAAGPGALPDQDAGVAAATRMQEQEYEARARAKRARGDEVRETEASDDGKRRSKKHKKHHKKEKRERSSRREPDLTPSAPPQHPQDRRFAQAPQADFDRRPGYPPQQQQQQPQGRGFNRQGSYNQQQGFNQPPGFQRKGSFNQDQGYGGRPDLTHRQQDFGPRDAAPQPRKRRQFSDRQGSRSRSRSRSPARSYSRSRSGSYSRSPSRSRLRSASPPRRYNRSVTPPPRRTFGPRPDQQRPAPAPVHGIPPPGSGPPPPPAPSQPYGVLPPVTSYPPSSGAFGHTAPNPLAGMFQPLPAAPPANLTLVNQQVAAEKAAKAAKRLYVGNIPFETSQAELTAFFDTIMADTGAVATDTEEQGSAVTSCTLYDRSSAAAGPKAKYAFLNLRSVEETSNCVAFDGVYLKTNSLKVRRPDDYDAKKVADLGPSEPSQALNSLVLSQLKRPPPPPPAPVLPPAPALGAAPSGDAEDGEVAAAAAPVVTRVLKLEHMVVREELLDEEEYSDIVDDISEEIETKYGHITQINIPRPATPADMVTTGVGFVYVAFEDPDAAVKAQKALHGRMFGENKIDASYYNEAQMQQKMFF